MRGTKQARKFGGRPVEREPEPGESTHLSVVVNRSLKQKIERAAAKRGWSISKEANHRLEMSFVLIEQAGLANLFGLIPSDSLYERLAGPPKSPGLLATKEQEDAYRKAMDAYQKEMDAYQKEMDARRRAKK
jgi:hypothetical protein